MKTQMLKMVQESISPVNPLDDSFSVLSKEIQRTIEKKKPQAKASSPIPQLNLKAKEFTPPVGLMKAQSSFSTTQPLLTKPPPGFPPTAANSQFYSPIAQALQ